MSNLDRIQHALENGLLPDVPDPFLVLPEGGSNWSAHFPQAMAWHPLATEALRLEAQTLSLSKIPQGRPLTILCHGRDRAETLGLLAELYMQMPKGAILAITGPKIHGIDGTLKQLKAAFGPLETVSKSHGKLIMLTVSDAYPDVLTKWKTAAAPAERIARFLTQPGLFSSGKIDPGSALLAQTFASHLSGRVADLGAGWGYLSAQALAQAPAISAISLYENDSRALDLARSNLNDPRANYHWCDVTRLTGHEGSFDHVISNPPFHAGREGMPQLGQAFIRAAAHFLHPKGVAYFVANRHLPYEDALTHCFAHWEETAGTAAFKVFRARKPKRV